MWHSYWMQGSMATGVCADAYAAAWQRQGAARVSVHGRCACRLWRSLLCLLACSTPLGLKLCTGLCLLQVEQPIWLLPRASGCARGAHCCDSRGRLV